MSDVISAVRAEERQRIARALHDGVCQDLAALILLADVHLRKLSQSSKPAPEAARIDHILDKTIADLHAVMAMLQPPDGHG